MSRITLLTVFAAMTLGWFALPVTTTTKSVNANRTGEMAVETFQSAVFAPVLGAKSSCLTISVEQNRWFRLGVASKRMCDDSVRTSRLLSNLSGTGHRHVQFVPPGLYKMGGASVLIGAAPEASPGATVCAGLNSWTLLLAPGNKMGFLPGDMMSNQRDLPVEPGQVFAHESGHAAACGHPELDTNEESIVSENEYLSVHIGPVMGRPIQRLLHDFPVPSARH